jgi:oxygen-independent coproporphyrinogen-3 oxidase
MARWIQRGLLDAPDADLAADMYELADTKLRIAGYESYEISNWAREDGASRLRACLHNLQYWRGKPYLGLGAGAHGFIKGIRTVNVIRPQDYIKQMQQEYQPGIFNFPVAPACMEYKILVPSEEMGEYLMVGLRLTQEGVAVNDFQKRFGLSLEDLYAKKIERLIKLELLEWVNVPTRRLRLTRRGRLLGNQVFIEFI